MRRGLLAERDELRSLRDRIAQRPFDAIYDALQSRCSLILESSPVTEPQWRSLWQQGSLNAALSAARTTQGRILDLLIAHHVDPNPAYRDRAIEELDNLVGWSTWVDPHHTKLPADLCTAEAAVAAVVALDWLWEDLDDSHRERVLEAVREKAIAPYVQGVEQRVMWCDCYHNWNAVVNSGCGLAALAMSDEDPQALEAYRMARENLNHFLAALGREGGWDEGTGYWGYAMRYLLLLGEAADRLLDDQSIFHARGMDSTGLFGVYFTPNGQPAGFGDAPAVPAYGTMYLLVKHFALKELTWWLDTYAFGRDAITSGWSAAGLALLFRPADAEPDGGENLPPMRVFHQIGWAAMADRWPRPGLYVAAKTGDLSANHSQRDMNAVQIQVDGEMFLVDLCSPPEATAYFAGQRDESYEVQAGAHNTIVVAERDHQIDAQGAILEAQSDEHYRWIVCDAGSACGESVRFIRHVVMLVDAAAQAGEAVVVLDELDNGVPERVDLTWHSCGKIDFDPEAMTGTISGRRSALHFALSATFKARAWVQTRQTNHHGVDRMLRLVGGVLGRALLLSVFARGPIEEQEILLETEDGEVFVNAAGRSLRFTPGSRHLQLEQIESA